MQRDENMNAKTISFILMMGVLGNIFFAISNYAGAIAPGIALDFSLIAVFIAGFYGGPVVGFVSGLFAGVFAGVIFGPMGNSSWLGLISLPIGKGLTGLTSGIISKKLNLGQRLHSSFLAVPATLLAYVPESLFTYIHFAYLMPTLIGKGGEFIFYLVLPKALGEVIVMGIFMAALAGNHGFNDFIRRFFAETRTTPKP
jgi:LytS/YehU family sensor histidine kinase